MTYPKVCDHGLTLTTNCPQCEAAMGDFLPKDGRLVSFDPTVNVEVTTTFETLEPPIGNAETITDDPEPKRE